MYLHQFFGNSPTPRPCAECQGDQRLDFDVRMAFQPIVDARDRSIHGYEALVRTMEGGGAADVLARVRSVLAQRPAHPPTGPSRDDLLQVIDAHCDVQSQPALF